MNQRNVGAGLVCLAFAGYVYWLSGSVPTGIALDPLGGRFLPRALSVALGVFAAALTITGLLGIQVKGGQSSSAGFVKNAPSDEEPAESPAANNAGEADQVADPDAGSTWSILAYILVMGVYVWLLPISGFLLTSFVAFSIFIVLLGQRNIARAAFGAAVITGGLYGLFGVVFNVRLPAGILF